MVCTGGPQLLSAGGAAVVGHDGHFRVPVGGEVVGEEQDTGLNVPGRCHGVNSLLQEPPMIDLVDLHEAIVIGAAGGIRVKAALNIGHGQRQSIGDAVLLTTGLHSYLEVMVQEVAVCHYVIPPEDLLLRGGVLTELIGRLRRAGAFQDRLRESDGRFISSPYTHAVTGGKDCSTDERQDDDRAIITAALALGRPPGGFMGGHGAHPLVADAAEKLLRQLSDGVLLQGVGVLSLHGEGGGNEESGAGPVGVGAVVDVDNAIGVQPHDPCVILIDLGGAPGRHKPLKALRQGQDVMVLAELVQGQRGHLAVTGAILRGAVEGGEVHGAGDDLIGVAVREAPQVGAIEVGPERAGGKVVGAAKGVGQLVQVQHEGAVLAVLQHQAGLSVVDHGLTGGDVQNSGFHWYVLLTGRFRPHHRPRRCQ